MTKEEMVKQGYSRVFRGGFDLLARYGDAPNENQVWEAMAREATALYEATPEEVQPLVLGVLKGVLDQIDRIYTQPKPPEQPQEEQKYYHFTL